MTVNKDEKRFTLDEVEEAYRCHRELYPVPKGWDDKLVYEMIEWGIATIRQQAEEIERLKRDVADWKESHWLSEESRKTAERELNILKRGSAKVVGDYADGLYEIDRLRAHNTALRECLESMLMSGFVDFERAQTLLAELDRHTEGTSLAAESVRHPYRGTMHYSRRESNFINSMDHSDRDHYIKQFIAACNSKQLMPFIKIVSHDKNWREVDYVVDIPNPPELDRKDTQPKECKTCNGMGGWNDGSGPLAEPVPCPDCFDGIQAEDTQGEGGR